MSQLNGFVSMEVDGVMEKFELRNGFYQMEVDGVVREIELRSPEIRDVGRLILEDIETRRLISVPITEVSAPAHLVKELRSGVID